MIILALNSSSADLSIALNVDWEISAQRIAAQRKHNLHVLPMVEQVLSKQGITLSEIDAVAFGKGPGSFTGLRIAAAVAQGIAFGTDIPTVPVSCLAAIAQKQDHDRVLAILKSRSGYAYWATYIKNGRGISCLHGDEHHTPLTEIVVDNDDWYGALSGWDVEFQGLQQLGNSVVNLTYDQNPDAREIAILGLEYFKSGHREMPQRALPEYLSPY